MNSERLLLELKDQKQGLPLTFKIEDRGRVFLSPFEINDQIVIEGDGIVSFLGNSVCFGKTKVTVDVLYSKCFLEVNDKILSLNIVDIFSNTFGRRKGSRLFANETLE